jgi:hypothetical protein
MRCAELKQRPEGKRRSSAAVGRGLPTNYDPRARGVLRRSSSSTLAPRLTLALRPPCYYDCRVSGDPGMCLFQDASFAHRSAFYSQTRSRACLRAEFTAGHQIRPCGSVPTALVQITCGFLENSISRRCRTQPEKAPLS